jgi:hypothetical protein
VLGSNDIHLDLAMDVVGSWSVKMTAFGTLKPPRPVFSAPVSSTASIVSPGLGTTNAVIASLHRYCDSPTTTLGDPRVGGVDSLLDLDRRDVPPAAGLDDVLLTSSPL